MSQHNASDMTPSDENDSMPDISKIIERARQQFISERGREPLRGESIFDHEPPSEVWSLISHS